MIDKSKETYDRYRDKARFLYQDVGKIHSENIRVPLHANVQITDEGAFVEAVVWVPKEELK